MFSRENIKKLLKKMFIKTCRYTAKTLFIYYVMTYYFFIPKLVPLLL